MSLTLFEKICIIIAIVVVIGGIVAVICISLKDNSKNNELTYKAKESFDNRTMTRQIDEKPNKPIINNNKTPINKTDNVENAILKSYIESSEYV